MYGRAKFTKLPITLIYIHTVVDQLIYSEVVLQQREIVQISTDIFIEDERRV